MLAEDVSVWRAVRQQVALQERDAQPEGVLGQSSSSPRPSAISVELTLISSFPFRSLQTGSRGFGLKAMEPIAKGSFVLDYRGEVRRPSLRSVSLSSLD